MGVTRVAWQALDHSRCPHKLHKLRGELIHVSGSLLLIAAVWLVLLAPLLLRNQKPVRRTAQALSETRVLHRGGSTLKAKRKLKPAEGLYMSSDDEDLELVDAEPEYVLLEDEDSPASEKSGKPRGLRALMTTKDSKDSEDLSLIHI